MLKWTTQGRGRGKEPRDHTDDNSTSKMPFHLKTKKSFKTTPVPSSSPSKAPPGPAYPSNGSTSTKTNGAPPSPAHSHTSSGSGDLARTTGQRTLEIVLPSGKDVTATVDAKLPMMDLLVMISQTNKLNPTGHVILPASAHRTDISQFKASQLVGRLDTTKLQIVPKLSQREIESIRGSEKKKAAQFEETIRLTLLSGKNQKTLVRVNPHKPIQDFLPIVHDETGIDIADFRLRLVKKPDDDIDCSKSLDFYGGVNELRLVDLRPPPPQEAEPAPIEKKKKSMFGRKTKKKDAHEPIRDTTERSPAVTASAAPPPPAPAPEPAPQTHGESAEAQAADHHGKKRRPAPAPPQRGKKEAAPHANGQLKPATDELSRAGHGVSKKRRAPAPPPAGPPQRTVATTPISEDPMAEQVPEVTMNGAIEQENHITITATTEVKEEASPSVSSGLSSPEMTPDSTLERNREERVEAAADIDDVEVDVGLADLDAALTGDQAGDEISLGSNGQSQTPAVEDPESGEKVRLDSSTTNEDEEEVEKRFEAEDVPVDRSEHPTEPTSKSKMEDDAESREERVTLTRMMKLSLDEDSNDTTSYSPTTHEEDADSLLEEKSLSSIAVNVTREPVASAPDREDKIEDKVEEDKVEKKEEKLVVASMDVPVESSPVAVEIGLSEGKREEEVEKVEEKEKAESKDMKEDDSPPKTDAQSHVAEPNMEQLKEQYSELQKQLAMVQQQLMMNTASVSPQTQVTPAVTYQAQQMQQMQQQIMLQQQLLLQQQQQHAMLSPQGGYVVMPPSAGGVVVPQSGAPGMVVPQPGAGMMMYPSMGMPTMPVYGAMSPPQAVTTPSVDVQVSRTPETQTSSAPQSSDETDSAVSVEPKVQTDSASEKTPMKPHADAPSGRRNVFADILKKKNSAKSVYVLSAKRESERHRSDSNPTQPGSTKDESTTGILSVNVNAAKPDAARTEIIVGASSPSGQATTAPITNGLSPTSPPSSSAGEGSISFPPTPPASTSPPKTIPSPVESNNNKAKTVSLEVHATEPSVTTDPTLPSPPDSLGGNQKDHKALPSTRPKPRLGPKPFRPVSMYARVPSSDQDEKPSSDHARKVADLRSAFE